MRNLADRLSKNRRTGSGWMAKAALSFWLLWFSFLTAQSLTADLSSNFVWTQPIGARLLGMGEAATADASDPTTMWWNPAGLTQVKGEHLFVMQQDIFSVIPHDTVVFTKSFSALSVGLFFSQIDPSEALGFDWKEEAIFLSFATSPEKGGLFSFGGNVKYGRLRTTTGRETYIGLDLGFLYAFSPQLRTGLMLQDIFARGTANTGTREKFAPRVSLGFSFSTDSATRFNLDIKDFQSGNPDTPLTFKFGVERWLDPVVAIRFGYILSDQDDLSRITGGVGVVLGPWELDYAFNPHPGPDTGETLRLSATYRLK